MRYNLSGINKPAFKTGCFFLLTVFFCGNLSFAGQLDLQYNHVGLPFAVFYNSSLIYDNSGVSLGVDTRYAGKNNHDVRASLTVPVAKAGGEKGYRSEYEDEDWFTRGLGGAFSVGMLYDSYDNYQISTGFGAYTKYFQFGASFDILYDDKIEDENEKLGLAVNLALAKEIMEHRLVSLVFRNVLVDERNERNWRGLTFGFGGVLNPNLILNTRLTGYVDRGKAKCMEGGASLNFYIPQFILKSSVDYSMNASAGFDIIRPQGQKTDNKFFMNIGVSLFRKSALTAALVGVDKSQNYLALLYNSNKKEDSALYLNLKFTESDSGKQFFHPECGSGKIESWILSLEDGGGRVIRTFSGGNIIPRTIEWDGLDYKEVFVKDLAIRAKLVVHDKRKNIYESETIIIKR